MFIGIVYLLKPHYIRNSYACYKVPSSHCACSALETIT
uniref:Uncharacterized protein n=1 Tax=Anguilla anguilla TaxID=7936 RepID=A0A0E9UXE5_ANGAN